MQTFVVRIHAAHDSHLCRVRGNFFAIDFGGDKSGFRNRVLFPKKKKKKTKEEEHSAERVAAAPSSKSETLFMTVRKRVFSDGL